MCIQLQNLKNVLPFLYNVRPRFRPNFRPNNKSSEVEAKAAIAGCNHYKNNQVFICLFVNYHHKYLLHFVMSTQCKTIPSTSYWRMSLS